MITSKHTRCARFVWAYVTRYSPLLATDIPAGKYSREEIERAITELEQQGYVAWGHEGYYAVVPFVLDEAWGC